MWIDFLFALWHFPVDMPNNGFCCGLTSYSLFDITFIFHILGGLVVDWLLIRSLTLTWKYDTKIIWLWIDFLFALWHYRVGVGRIASGCGLTSYSLFDISTLKIQTLKAVVDWLLIRSLTLCCLIGICAFWLWIDFLFALWHYTFRPITTEGVVDWLLIRSLTLRS